MLWFGESWGAPVCEPQRHAPTPVGGLCIECDTPIREGDTGFVSSNGVQRLFYHRVCFLRTVIPCEMWDAEMTTVFLYWWRGHRDERHSHLTQ